VAVEDQRAAVGFSITLSSQLIAASMAMLAVEAAYLWYALASRSPRTGFVISAGLAALAILLSIFVAGKGITKARNAGFKGNWDLDAGKEQFNFQAILLLLAILMLFVTFALSGPVRESALERRVDVLTGQIAVLREELNKRKAEQEKEREIGPGLQPLPKETPTTTTSPPHKKLKRKKNAN
jgi:hypothetical protein